MSLLQTYGKEIVALLVPFVAWILSTYFKSKPRLQVSTPHGFVFRIPQPLIGENGQVLQPQQAVHTRSDMIKNDGRETATNVELVYNWMPFSINVWPIRHYESIQAQDGRYHLKFGTLAPGEILGCEILSINSDLPNLVTVRCDQGVGKTVEMWPQRIFQPWVYRVAGFFFWVGVASLIYWSIVLTQFLVLSTPVVSGGGS